MLLSVFLSSQKGDNFRVIDRVFVGPFNIIGVSQYLWAWVGGKAEKWIGSRRFIFLLPSSCASRSAQNAAFALLGSLSACYSGYCNEKLL